MPRTYSKYERALTKAGAYTLHPKIEIQDAAGAWRDVARFRNLTGLALYLPFDDSTATDRSGAGNNGILRNGPTFAAYSGGAQIVLDGLNDYVEVPSVAALKYTGGELTAFARVLLTVGDVTTGWIFSKPWNGSGDYNWWLRVESDRRISLVLQGIVVLTTAAAVSAGVQHTIGFTVDSAKNAKIYVDGAVAASGTHAITNWTPAGGDASLPLAIGTQYPYGGAWAGDTSMALAGQLDEVRVYTRTLGADEMADLHADSGIDFFERATWKDEIDPPSMDGQLELVREHGALSLAPFVTASPLNKPAGTYSPAIDSTRGVRISVATVEAGLLPGRQLLRNSDTPGGTGWASQSGGTGSAVTVTTGIADPFGGTLASRLQFAQGAGATINDYSLMTNTPPVGALAGAVHAASIWLRSRTGANQTMMIAMSGSVGLTAIVVTPTWQRFWTVGIYPNNTAPQLQIGVRGTVTPGGSVADVDAFGGMVDQFNGLTSYVSTGAVEGLTSYKEMFVGVLANPEWGGRDTNAITCAIRDIGHLLMMKNAESDVVYGSDAGTSLETVIQQILDANVNAKLATFATGSNGINSTTGAVTLYTPVASGIVVNKFTFPTGPVLAGLRDLCANFGWDIKFRYDAAGNFRLTLFNPPRGKSTIDDTFTADEYIDLPRFGLLDDDVRNILDVVYKDKVSGALATVRKTNSASITAFGPRYHRIPAGGPVNTSALATALGVAIDNDLALPYAQQDMVGVFCWFLQTHDLYAFPSNGVLYDSTQNLAVVGVAHVLEGGDGTSTMTTRGQVAGQYKNWILAGGLFVDAGPSLEVTATPGSPNYSIAYVGSAPVELSINGGAWAAAPASPFTVARPAAGGTPLEYTFRIIADGQTVTDMVTIQPIDLDTNTVTPDLVITPGSPTATTMEFGLAASNPAGGAAPSLFVLLKGTTGTGSVSGAFADGVEKAASAGEVITVNRPAWGTVAQATAAFRATIAGQGTERIQRSILTQVKTSYGPQLVVEAVPGATSYQIFWSGSAGTILSINGGAGSTPPASPFTVTRPAAGSQDLDYSFSTPAIDGISAWDSVHVAAIDKDTVTADLNVVPSAPTATTQDFQVFASNPVAGGPTPTITVTLRGCTATIFGVPRPDGSVVTLLSTDHVVVDRPAFGTVTQASLTFTASIAGGGVERIQRTVPNQVGVGPSLDVQVVPSALSYGLYVTPADGTVFLRIDGGGGSPVSSSPITVTRPLPGAASLNYEFIKTVDLQTVSNTVIVPARDSDTKNGVEILSNPEFRNGLTGFLTYDNAAGGQITISLATSPDFQNSSGKGMQVHYAATINAGVNASPGFGGFYVGIGVDNGTWQKDQYHRAAPIRVTLIAALPVGTTIVYTTNAIGTGGTVEPLTDMSGTGTYKTYVWLVTIGSTGSFSTTGFFYLTNTGIGNAPGVAFDMYVAKCSFVDENMTPIPADVPDLTVTPSSPSATWQDFTVTAANPTKGVAPTVTVYLDGCSGANQSLGGVGIPANTLTTIASGTVVRVFREPFGTTTQASATFAASLVGGGSERIQRSIPNQVKVSFGPSLTVTPTPGTSSYSLAYSGTYSSLLLSIDGGSFSAPAASPITVTRTTSDHTYVFKATLDGQDVPVVVTVPALDPVTSAQLVQMNSCSFLVNSYTTDDFSVSWTDDGTIGSGHYEIWLGIDTDAPYLADTQSAGSLSKVVSAGVDLVSIGGTTHSFSIFVRAVSSTGSFRGQSPTTQHNFNTNP